MNLGNSQLVLHSVTAFLGSLSWAEALGYVGAVLSIAANSMRTMIPLRCLGIVTNCIFIAYGLLCGVYPTMIVNLVVLPLNIVRLSQMASLIRKVRKASESDLSMDWLKPFMTKRPVKRGEILFEKGDAADVMFYTLSGRYRLRELAIEIPPGHVVGEMGLLAPDNRRTQSLECLDDGEVLAITYDELRQLYFQNPEFGFFFLKLTSSRLFENMAIMEREIDLLRSQKSPSETAVRAA